MRLLLCVGVALGALLWVGHTSAATARASVTRFQRLKAIALEGEALRVVVLPERGANVISVYDKRSKREWMWQNPWDPYKRVRYGSSYMDADVSGFDDCFPTIGRQAYPEAPWKGAMIPDHGEVWSLPWSWRIRGGTVRLWVRGRRLPYHFEKEISLQGNDHVRIRYRVTNLSRYPMDAIWAGHALVAVRPGMEIFLPPDTRFKDKLDPWSLTTKHDLAWIRFGGPETKSGKKLFTERLSDGWGGFYDGTTGEYLLYTFPEAKVPYFGLWINQGVLLVRGHRHYNVGLEPTTGGEDFRHSREHGMRSVLPPRATLAWDLNLFVGKASRGDLRRRVAQVRE